MFLTSFPHVFYIGLIKKNKKKNKSTYNKLGDLQTNVLELDDYLQSHHHLVVAALSKQSQRLAGLANGAVHAYNDIAEHERWQITGVVRDKAISRLKEKTLDLKDVLQSQFKDLSAVSSDRRVSLLVTICFATVADQDADLAYDPNNSAVLARSRDVMGKLADWVAEEMYALAEVPRTLYEMALYYSPLLADLTLLERALRARADGFTPVLAGIEGMPVLPEPGSEIAWEDGLDEIRWLFNTSEPSTSELNRCKPPMFDVPRLNPPMSDFVDEGQVTRLRLIKFYHDNAWPKLVSIEERIANEGHAQLEKEIQDDYNAELPSLDATIDDVVSLKPLASLVSDDVMHALQQWRSTDEQFEHVHRWHADLRGIRWEMYDPLPFSIDYGALLDSIGAPPDAIGCADDESFATRLDVLRHAVLPAYRVSAEVRINMQLTAPVAAIAELTKRGTQLATGIHVLRGGAPEAEASAPKPKTEPKASATSTVLPDLVVSGTAANYQDIGESAMPLFEQIAVATGETVPQVVQGMAQLIAEAAAAEAHGGEQPAHIIEGAHEWF